MKNRILFVAAIVAVAAVAAFLVWPESEKDLTLYCSVDQDQSLEIVNKFKVATGITVNFQGETEASRGVGITQALVHEQKHPRADVLWANEIMNTVYMRDIGLFAPLPPGIADSFPPEWRDPKGRYVAFGARARILLVNTALLPDPKDWPTSVDDLVDPKWGGKDRGVAVAIPLTGTTYTHAVAMLVRDADAGKAFWTQVADRVQKGEVKAFPGNGAVMQRVKDPKNGIAWGMTDTDDAYSAITEGAPVAVVYPDQAEGKPGTVLIPNTVALIQGAPNPEAGRKLLEWLVSKDTEALLARGPTAQMPLREDVPVPAHVKKPGKDFRAAVVDWQAVGAKREDWLGFLRGLFQR